MPARWYWVLGWAVCSLEIKLFWRRIPTISFTRIRQSWWATMKKKRFWPAWSPSPNTPTSSSIPQKKRRPPPRQRSVKRSARATTAAPKRRLWSCSPLICITGRSICTAPVPPGILSATGTPTPLQIISIGWPAPNATTIVPSEPLSSARDFSPAAASGGPCSGSTTCSWRLSWASCSTTCI